MSVHRRGAREGAGAGEAVVVSGSTARAEERNQDEVSSTAVTRFCQQPTSQPALPRPAPANGRAIPQLLSSASERQRRADSPDFPAARCWGQYSRWRGPWKGGHL